MRPATIRMPVVVGLLAGFVITLAVAGGFGASMLAARPFSVLFALVALAVLLSIGLTAWDTEGVETHPVASGCRTFSCVLTGAALAAIVFVGGGGVAGACLALALPAGLLSMSLDRRAWLAY
jgi:hypothetical protein